MRSPFAGNWLRIDADNTRSSRSRRRRGRTFRICGWSRCHRSSHRGGRCSCLRKRRYRPCGLATRANAMFRLSG